MKVKVIGKENITSKKTGEVYTLVNYTYQLRGQNKIGEKGGDVFLNGTEYPYESIKVGSMYNVDRNETGRLIDFTAI